MAAGTIGSRRKQTVIDFGAQPSAGRFMAALANRLAIVNSGRRPTCCPIAGAHVAGRALRRNGDIAMKLPRIPACVTSLVAAIAIGDGHTAECHVRNMVDRLAVRRRIGATVAGGALVGYRHLAVIPLGGLPCRDAMATHTIHAGRDMCGRFTGSGAPVVTRRAGGRCRE